MSNGKIVQVVLEGHEGHFEFYRGNGDVTTPFNELPQWAEGVVGVQINEYANYWATALPSEQAALKLSSDRIDMRDLNLLVVDPESRQTGELELMEQPADIAYRMSQVQEILDLDLSVTDASDQLPEIEGYRTVAEAEIDTTYLDNPGNDEITLAQAEADGFGLIRKAEERKTVTGS